MKKNLLLIISVFIFSFVIILLPKISHASLASVTAGATFVTADGSSYSGMSGTVINVRSNRDNTHKGQLTSGCYSCRTGSQWKNGTRQEYYPDTAVATKTTSVSGGTWGISFNASSPKYQFGCGASKCTTAPSDGGDCNSFNIQMTHPASSIYSGGHWFRYAVSSSDPGGTSGTVFALSHTDSYSVSANLYNGSRTYVRLDYRANRAPSPTVENPGNKTAPATIGFRAYSTDEDGDRGQVQVMWKKTTESVWHNFGSNNNAEDPDGNHTAVANNVTTPNINPWGWSWNSNPAPTDGWVNNATWIYYPNVTLGEGTYQVAARGIDVHSLYSSTWDIKTFTVSSSEPTNYNLNVDVNPFGAGTILGKNPSNTTIISCGSDCNESLASGTVATISASAKTGNTFVNWSGTTCPINGSTNFAPQSFPVSSNISCTANFQVPPTLSCELSPQNGPAPLYVRVSANTTGINNPVFDYDFEGLDNYLPAGTSPAVAYHTFVNAGTYIVKIKELSTGLIATCLPSVIVTSPTDNSGGEVAP